MTRTQRGYSLIELMIGMLVGLIVLSAVIYAFITSLQSARDVRNSAVLNREGSSIIDLVTGEIRRTGYYPVQLVVSGAASPFGAGTADLYVNDTGLANPDQDCVLFSYYDESASAVLTRGFFYDGTSSLYYGTIASLTSASCSSATLTNLLNDPDRVRVTNFDVSIDECLEASGTTISSASASLCQAASVTEKTFIRSLALAVSMAITTDDEWVFESQEYIRLPNDLSD